MSASRFKRTGDTPSLRPTMRRSLVGRRITCDVCGLGYSEMEWRENLGYCPNCDQPYGANARRILNLPRTDLEPEESTLREEGEAPQEEGA